MLMFGTAVNRLMNNIEDTGLLIPFDAIYHEKKSRHIGAYIRFSLAKRRNKEVMLDPDVEKRMIEDWLNKRFRKVRRLLRRAGRNI